MSTYNGKRYVTEQIESILKQKVNSNNYTFDLYIRDDGSKDGTQAILNSFTKAHSNVFLLQNSGRNLGIRNSFYSLLENVEADFYFFSDQDDIWLKDKVSEFVCEFEKNNNKIPSGVYSDLELIDASGESMHKTMMQGQGWKYDEKRDLALLMFQTRVTGAAFAINRAARNKLLMISDKNFANVLMHDSVAALLTQVYDNLHFIPATLVKYRQHENNVLGAAPQKHSQFEIKFKINHYQRLFHDLVLVIRIIDRRFVSPVNLAMLDAATDFLKQDGSVGRGRSILRNYKCFWKKFRLRHTILLLFYYRNRLGKNK